MPEDVCLDIGGELIITKQSKWNDRWQDWMLYLKVRRQDKKDGITWDQLQTAKNLIVGSDALAIEVYPPNDRLVNSANVRHLWVIPHKVAVLIGIPDLHEPVEDSPGHLKAELAKVKAELAILKSKR
jgi:hypothetical protein